MRWGVCGCCDCGRKQSERRRNAEEENVGGEAAVYVNGSGPRGCQWQPVNSGSDTDSDSNIRDNQSNNRC